MRVCLYHRHGFVWYFDALKNSPLLWISILLLTNIPAFTIYYRIGYMQYNKENATKQETDSDFFQTG
jgi:hypothetical protein